MFGYCLLCFGYYQEFILIKENIMENNNKVLLIILDGWGLSPIEEGNAILQAKTPVLDSLISQFPHSALSASGNEVGLENGEMGNSEVGHLNLGTGRISQQDLPRINNSISDGSFYDNDRLLEACNWVKKNNSKLHLLGLVSNGGIHSHIDHLLALLELAKKQNIKDVVIHMITDGRDCPAKSSESFLEKLNQKIKETGVGKIVTVSGRFYAMDRDKNWERIEKAYNAMVLGEGEQAVSAETAIKSAYERGESDENITPTAISNSQFPISNNDAIVFFNYRQDRAKQLASALCDPEFKGFKRKKIIKNMFFVSFTNFGHEPSPLVKIAFFADKIQNQLAKIISESKLTQLHIAETEKYAHVTHFFNGGIEKEFAGEKRILIPSPKVATYDKKPEMSAIELTKQLTTYNLQHRPDFTVLNFANPDMVGHTGNLTATIKACETVDKCLGKILLNLCTSTPLNLIIVGDHGNAEQMINPTTKDPDKEHTTNSVPFILVNSDKRLAISDKQMSIEEKMTFAATQPTGVLADVSPTIIDLLGLQKPQEMNGQSLKDII